VYILDHPETRIYTKIEDVQQLLYIFHDTDSIDLEPKQFGAKQTLLTLLRSFIGVVYLGSAELKNLIKHISLPESMGEVNWTRDAFFKVIN